MATYILLMNWTDQGVKAAKDSPKRLDASREMAKAKGIQIRDFYMVMGKHDMVVVAEAPSDEAVAQFILSLAGKGNVRSTTMKAFSEAEYRSIMQSL
jgi:uncharacterized protein with GYD domain